MLILLHKGIASFRGLLLRLLSFCFAVHAGRGVVILLKNAVKLRSIGKPYLLCDPFDGIAGMQQPVRCLLHAYRAAVVPQRKTGILAENSVQIIPIIMQRFLNLLAGKAAPAPLHILLDFWTKSRSGAVLTSVYCLQ